jgi:hypothetical protein
MTRKLQYIYERLGTAYHPVGTCRIGDPVDPMTVVDPDLRVIGLENVLIADVAADRIMGMAGSSARPSVRLWPLPDLRRRIDSAIRMTAHDESRRSES